MRGESAALLQPSTAGDSSSHALLEVHNLKRVVGGRIVLSNVSFSLHENEVLLVRGPSGVGKSLLLRALAGLDALQEGTLRLGGKAPHQHGYPTWRSNVMYVTQARVPFTGTPAELYYQAQRLSAQRGRARGDLPALVHALGLEQPVLNQPWAELSGGQAQRVLLAITIALKPSVLLLDEPTSACDAQSARRVEQVLFNSGLALVWVTHDDSLLQRLPQACSVLELPLATLTLLQLRPHPPAPQGASLQQ